MCKKQLYFYVYVYSCTVHVFYTRTRTIHVITCTKVPSYSCTVHVWIQQHSNAADIGAAAAGTAAQSGMLLLGIPHT